MKKIKALLLIALVAIFAVGGSGCMKNNKHIICDYLAQKYTTEFFVDEEIASGIDVGFEQYYCHSVDFPNMEFTVYYDGNEYYDNYYGILINLKYQALIKEGLNEYFSNYKVFFNFTSNYFDYSVVDVSKLSEYINKYPEQFFSNIYVCVEKNDELNEIEYENICESLKKELKNFYVCIYTVEDINKITNEDEFIINENKIFSKTVK